VDVLFRYCYIWKGNTKTAARMRPAATAAHVSTASMLMATSGEDDGVIGIANRFSPLREVSPGWIPSALLRMRRNRLTALSLNLTISKLSLQ
jgi:hypothetical protein